MCWKKISLLLIALALTACTPPPPPLKQTTVIFGTSVSLLIPQPAPPQADEATAAVFAHFQTMHKRFHAWREGELHALNARIAAGTLPATMSPAMTQMLVQAKRYFTYSEGLFNPAIGRLVHLWGFHADTLPHTPPAHADIAALVQAGADMSAIDIDSGNHQLLAAPPAVQLDFGALAKGAALDAAREILHTHGIKNALIDIGGNIMALGTNNNTPWRVAIAADRQQPPVMTLTLHDGEAVATSGDSERYFMYQGRRYHHIIDPRSGYPAATVSAATVIAAGKNAGAISDAAATALVIADEATAARIMRHFGITLTWRPDTPPSPALKQRL